MTPDDVACRGLSPPSGHLCRVHFDQARADRALGALRYALLDLPHLRGREGAFVLRILRKDPGGEFMQLESSIRPHLAEQVQVVDVVDERADQAARWRGVDLEIVVCCVVTAGSTLLHEYMPFMTIS